MPSSLTRIENLLSRLFPPRLPGKIRDWHNRVELEIVEQGWAGNVKRVYRNGIERYFSELETEQTKPKVLKCELEYAEYAKSVPVKVN